MLEMKYVVKESRRKNNLRIYSHAQTMILLETSGCFTHSSVFTCPAVFPLFFRVCVGFCPYLPLVIKSRPQGQRHTKPFGSWASVGRELNCWRRWAAGPGGCRCLPPSTRPASNKALLIPPCHQTERPARSRDIRRSTPETFQITRVPAEPTLEPRRDRLAVG